MTQTIFVKKICNFLHRYPRIDVIVDAHEWCHNGEPTSSCCLLVAGSPRILFQITECTEMR